MFLFLDLTKKRRKCREIETKLDTIQMDTVNSIAEDGEAKKKKKARTTFTGRQIFELEKQFELKKYLSSSERSEMAKLLNVTETQVGITLFLQPCSLCAIYSRSIVISR